jgi:protein-S-isoprenylcysteine O-methyltransferase Ste14
VLCSYYLVFQALKANSFASSVVKVEADQRVISDGPYGIVRHPMYSGLLVLLLSLPLALGSCIAIPVFVLLIVTLIFRLLREEKTLRQELPGYSEYCQRSRFRLVPFLW